MSRKRQKQAEASAQATAKIDRPADAKLDLANVLGVYDCSNEAVSSWLRLCEHRRAGLKATGPSALPANPSPV